MPFALSPDFLRQRLSAIIDSNKTYSSDEHRELIERAKQVSYSCDEHRELIERAKQVSYSSDEHRELIERAKQQLPQKLKQVLSQDDCDLHLRQLALDLSAAKQPSLIGGLGGAGEDLDQSKGDEEGNDDANPRPAGSDVVLKLMGGGPRAGLPQATVQRSRSSREESCAADPATAQLSSRELLELRLQKHADALIAMHGLDRSDRSDLQRSADLPRSAELADSPLRFNREFHAWRERVWEQALAAQEYDDDPFGNTAAQQGGGGGGGRSGGAGKAGRNFVLLKHINAEGEEVVQEVGDIFRRDVDSENPLVVDYRQKPIVGHQMKTYPQFLLSVEVLWYGIWGSGIW